MRKTVITCTLILLVCSSLFAQSKKYPSLLWEITGNGLQKPSYLFGTMHVSSKLAFHLSDSFYIAIKNADAVALELNPYYWQRDMMQADDAQKKIVGYMRSGANNYVDEKSFQFEKYEDNIKAALTDQPLVVNSLLYRSYQAQEDYEENTYLDLYIYQTGRKLGKQAAGVEDYYQTQRIVFEAYQDALKEKNKRKVDTDGESAYDIEKKIQIAYRQGNLDMLDSLEKFQFASAAFVEKFLYKRNEIQAHSIDTIVKHRSLFVGVGAAHLPGKRGVIELLRKMGYKLRPIMMQDRNADKKDEIDRLKVPVTFTHAQTADGAVTMNLPGPLYKRTDVSNVKTNESWQYADMDNGTYYSVIRVKTHAGMFGQSSKVVQQKTDSLLYENIPGKILKKTVSQKDGFPVIDITNRTRRGDLQRYNIIITPFEEVICKMSGNEDYVSGTEADNFFSSVHVDYHLQKPIQYTSNSAGFMATFPQLPYSSITNLNSDRITRVAFEAIDTATGNAYTVWKKTVNNYRFMEEDTFDLGLIEESLKRSEIIDKQLSRSFTNQDGFSALNMKFSLQNGGTLFAKAVLRGAHYYLVTATGKAAEANAFLNSFHLAAFGYANASLYKDTSMHFTVQTPVQPQLDTFLMRMTNEALDARSWGQTARSIYNEDFKTAFFKNDSTGEAVLVNCTMYPKYFYSKDSASFWKEMLDPEQFQELIVKEKSRFVIDDSCSGYKIVLQDTNTVRQITSLLLLKNNRLYQVTAISDTVNKESAFLQTFFKTFRPDDNIKGQSVFADKQALFFKDYASKDSLTHKLADDAIAKVKYTCASIPQLSKVISSLSYKDKNYFETKTKFIRELGYIHEPECAIATGKLLSTLFKQTADTAYFQNEILLSLARLKTTSAYDTLQALLLQDPPIFDNNNDYDDLFELIQDSLLLSKRMYPDLLQLSSIESYKKPVNDLLLTLVDSGMIKATDYQSYFSRIYFDAKIELKKLQNEDEKLLEKQNNKEDDDVLVAPVNDYSYRYRKTGADELQTYSTLLMPFYDSVASVPIFFSKQLRSKNPATQLEVAVLMAKNKKPVPDSIWQSLAAKDRYRAQLMIALDKIKRKELFPKNENNQEALAKSVLLNDKNQDSFYSVQLVNKELISSKKGKGYVYFFKYKISKDDEWKMGISGLQPVNLKEASANDDITNMTDKKFANDKTVNEQFEEQLKQLLFRQHESAYSFFTSDAYSGYGRDDYDD